MKKTCLIRKPAGTFRPGEALFLSGNADDRVGRLYGMFILLQRTPALLHRSPAAVDDRHGGESLTFHAQRLCLGSDGKITESPLLFTFTVGSTEQLDWVSGVPVLHLIQEQP